MVRGRSHMLKLPLSGKLRKLSTNELWYVVSHKNVRDAEATELSFEEFDYGWWVGVPQKVDFTKSE